MLDAGDDRSGRSSRAPPSETRTPDEMPRSESPLRILVIDDHLLFAEGIRSQLQGLAGGAEVTVATEASKCVALACRAPPFDLIISDLYMPDLDGFALLKALQANGVETPAIALESAACPGGGEALTVQMDGAAERSL